MGVSSLGVGSGLDLESLLTKLMKVEQAPLTRLQTKKTTTTSQISALGKIKSAMDAFKTAATALKDPDKLLPNAATLTDATVATVTAASNAIKGTHNIEVTQLATADKQLSSALYNNKLVSSSSSSSVTVKAGDTLTLNVGGSSIDISTFDGTETSLSDVADRINTAVNNAGVGVTASVMADGSGAQRLVLSNSSGSSDQITVSGNLGTALGFSSAATNAGDTLTLSAGGKSTTITFDGTESLTSVANRINAANTGVSVSVINGTNGSQLVMTSDATGDANRFTVSGTLGNVAPSAPGAAPGVGPGFTRVAGSGQDAKLKIDGVDIASASNTVRDALTGVTLELKKTNTNAPTQLTISEDKSALRDKAEAFVKEYNTLINTLKDLSKYAPGGASGVLNGDSTVRSLLSQIRGNVYEVPSGLDESFKHLYNLGIQTQTDGTLKFDVAVLDAAVTKDSAAVAKSLSAYGTSFEKLAFDMSKTDGLISTRTQGLEQVSKTLDTQIEQMSRYLEKVEARYRSQFASMDTLVGEMNKISEYLTQQLPALSSLASRR